MAVTDGAVLWKTSAERSLRVAIACPGIGLVQRGFERLFYDLFNLVRDEGDVVLFKGGGAACEREKVLWFAHRNGALPKVFPIHKLFRRTPMHSECMTFALALLPYLRGGKFDVVHCIDPPLARVLYKLRDFFCMDFRLLYTEGCAMPPADYPPADHIQQIAEVTYAEAVKSGIPESHMTRLPCGIHPERFVSQQGKLELRKKYGIDENLFVIVSVSAINRRHKRTHHLIEEVAQLDDNCLLWLDGSLDHGDPELINFARDRLGHRCKITHVPSEKVADLYAIADVMVHCAVYEAFGLAIVEAASTGLPVITHNAPHFRWLLPNPEAWIDMEVPGDLARRLSYLISNPGSLQRVRCQVLTRDRFSWENLKGRYLELYQYVADLPCKTVEMK